MPEARVAGVDLGTTRAKLVIYNEGLEKISQYSIPQPLTRGRNGRAYHDPQGLISNLETLISKARSEGARAVGVTLYRASVTAWRPGPKPLEPVILWLDRYHHRDAYQGLPALGRVASHLPVYNKILSPTSPLPLISMLAREHPGARVWTVDALLRETLGAGFTSSPSHAALTGLINPRGLKPIPLAAGLAGLPRGFEAPDVGETLLPRGSRAQALTADQQAGLIGLGLARGCWGCVKLSLGTGAFADRPIRGEPPLFTGRGLIPLVLYRVHGRTGYGLESLVPGAGEGLRGIIEAVGGFQGVHELTLNDCREWSGALLIPYPAGRGAGMGWDIGALLGLPAGRWDLVCASIIGVALSSAFIASLHEGVERYYLTGTVARIPLVRQLLEKLLPGETIWCPEDPTPRGAAILALASLGLTEPWRVEGPECMDPVKGAGEVRTLKEPLDELYASNPKQGELEDILEPIRETIYSLLM